MSATATAPMPTKIEIEDIKASSTFYNPDDTGKLLPLRIVHVDRHVRLVKYRIASDTMKTVSFDLFVAFADALGYKKTAHES